MGDYCNYSITNFDGNIFTVNHNAFSLYFRKPED